jgi:nitrate reductase gamma subunit
MPIHVRWEVYPVPKEKGKLEYGGSYYEEVDWWKKPREVTLIGELKEMFSEMLFLKRAYIYKRKLWYFTYPFHAGIYLILVWFALLFIGALMGVLGFSDGWFTAIRYLTVAVGGLGIVVTTVGCVGTILIRLSDYGMRTYSAPIDYFNLLFILAVLLTGAYAWQFDPKFLIAREYMASLISFGSIQQPDLNTPILIHLILLELLFIYIPFTKMTHFIGKYFTFHKVLWDDEPNLKGSEIERKVKEVLNYRVSWSAPHITGKTWAEEVTEVEL